MHLQYVSVNTLFYSIHAAAETPFCHYAFSFFKSNAEILCIIQNRLKMNNNDELVQNGVVCNNDPNVVSLI